jgi:hypothetical protein
MRFSPMLAQRIAQGERQRPEHPGKVRRVHCFVAAYGPVYELAGNGFGLAQDPDDDPANGAWQARRPLRQIGKRKKQRHDPMKDRPVRLIFTAPIHRRVSDTSPKTTSGRSRVDGSARHNAHKTANVMWQRRVEGRSH